MRAMSPLEEGDNATHGFWGFDLCVHAHANLIFACAYHVTVKKKTFYVCMRMYGHEPLEEGDNATYESWFGGFRCMCAYMCAYMHTM